MRKSSFSTFFFVKLQREKTCQIMVRKICQITTRQNSVSTLVLRSSKFLKWRITKLHCQKRMKLMVIKWSTNPMLKMDQVSFSILTVKLNSSPFQRIWSNIFMIACPKLNQDQRRPNGLHPWTQSQNKLHHIFFNLEIDNK